MAANYPKKSLLYPGQSLSLHAFRGTTIVALRGEIQLSSPPLCIGEHILRNTVIVHEGQAYALESTGWIMVHARTVVELACVASTNKAGTWRGALLTAWFGTWRRLAYDKARES